MKNHLLLGALALGWLALASTPCLAQVAPVKATDPYAFTTRSYRLPADELSLGFVSKDRGKLRAPALPPASAGSGEMEAFLKTSHEVVRDFLELQGITLPGGSLACYDPASSTLVLRAMNMVHDLIVPFADAVRRQVPKHVAWSLDILEAPAADVRAAVKELTGQTDHRAVYEKLQTTAKSVVSMRGETKSGAPTSARQGGSTEFPTEYTTDSKNRVLAAMEMFPNGTEVELEPTVGVDDRTVDLNVRLTHPYAPPTSRWEPLGNTTPEAHAAECMDRPVAMVKTAITVISPATRMLGVWTLDGASDAARASGAMQAAFLHAAVVPLLPLEDTRAEGLLKAHGEKVIPTPKEVRPVADPKLPPGMIVRRLRVPPDFLSAGNVPLQPAATADAFAAGGVPNEPRFTRKMTVEEILRSAGIPFPEGSSANYLAMSSELVVRNTPENIAKVEEYLAEMRHAAPRLVAFTLQIVQADAALIRKLQRDTLSLPDHRAAWKEVEDAVAANRAKIVRTSRTETKSGAPFSTQNVIEYARSTGLESGGGTQTQSEKKEGAQATASAQATIVNPNDHPDYGATLDSLPVGLRLEAEPTVGADCLTLDVNISVDYDYALPTLRAPRAAPAGAIPMSVPTLQLHNTSFKTSTVMLSGATRLLSVWKPEGAPELDGDVLQAAFLRTDIVTLE